MVGSLPSSASANASDDITTNPPSMPLRDFTITIEPTETLQDLHSKIEERTGLKAEQQRLIYKGRLISSSNSNSFSQHSNANTNTTAANASAPLDPLSIQISNVAGLENGHTIHLVPRPVPPPVTTTTSTTTGTGIPQPDHHPDDINTSPTLASTGFLSGIGGAGILSALLNLDRDDGDDEDLVDPLETLFSMPRNTTAGTGAGGTRAARGRRRRPNAHRRLATDARHTEPCPLEPLRQGMMTLHTMVGSQTQQEQQEQQYTPFVDRKWFKGQWMDIRDTVNQWLEATVVDILAPDDLLVRVPKTRLDSSSSSAARNISVVNDPAIGANDLEGRMKLLLEPSNMSDHTLADLNDNQELLGYKERRNNDSVQILLVHYNGWPHRWDEWIRSDSERIRPFRTRSKHVANRNHLCPCPESTFHSAPLTHVRSDNDEIDRMAILPELYTALGQVQDIFASAMGVEKHVEKQQMPPMKIGHEDEEVVRPLSRKEQTDLSVAMQELNEDYMEEILTIVQGENEGGKDMDPSDIVVADLDLDTQWKLKKLLESASGYPADKPSSSFELGDDQCLPWKSTKSRHDCGDDSASLESGSGRGGRRREEEECKQEPKFDKRNLEALGPLLDRLGRILIDVAPHVATIADSLPDPPQPETIEDTGTTPSEETEEGLVSMTMDDASTSLRPSWAQTTAPSLFESESNESANNNNNDDILTNPDYVDFVHGFINHTSESPSRRNSSRRNQGEGGLGSSLLSAYLASALGGGITDNGNGPRVVRVGGNDGDGGGGSGLDIHIHAIVTGPGGGGGLPDMNFMQTAGARTARPNTDNGVTVVPSHLPADEEDTGVLDHLYSENPPQEDFRPNNGRDDEIEIEDEDDQSYDNSYSDDSEIPRLLSPHASDSTSSDDDSDNESQTSLPPLLERHRVNSMSSSDGESSSDDSAPPLLVRHRVNSMSSSDGESSSDDSAADDEISSGDSVMSPLESVCASDSESEALGRGDDSASDTPPLKGDDSEDDKSMPTSRESTDEERTLRNPADTPGTPLVIDVMSGGDAEMCVTQMDGDDNNTDEFYNKNESDMTQQTASMAHHLSEISDDSSLETSLHKCDLSIPNHEARLGDDTQRIRDDRPPPSLERVTPGDGNADLQIESVRPSLFHRIFRRRSED